MSNHNKNVKLLFACLDWRLHPQLENYFIQSQDGCDLCITAGSIKGLVNPVTRDYFLAEDDGGRRFWLFREGFYGEDILPRWFVHGFFA